MNNLYQTEEQSKNELCVNEIGANDYEKKFLEIISDEMTESLNINYMDRRIVSNLIFSCLENKVCRRDGLLEQYFNSQIDLIADNLRHEFDISKNIKVNYKHANHAKFNDLFTSIKQKNNEDKDNSND